MNRRLGILGCGQLGQMLARAAKKLGAEVSFLMLDESPVVDGLGRIYSEAELDAFLASVDFVTIEREAIAEPVLQACAEQSSLAPSYNALIRLRQRHTQKELFDTLGLPTSPWAFIESAAQFQKAHEILPGKPIRAKRVLGGYDGGGQWRIGADAELPVIDEALFPVILEAEIAVEDEISILLARSDDGEIRHYPINQNVMRDGILTWSFVPAEISTTLADKAREYAERLVTGLDYVGVLAMEFFISGGELMINEIAPRVHNTGHWTIEGCLCDQFEQHVRAVMGMPLLDPTPVAAAGMCNILGDHFPRSLPESPVRMYLHGYGKTLRLGRKMGHLTLTGPDTPTIKRAAKAMDLFSGDLTEH